ncbi:MAG: type 4a pilus biogenesis protein PilO [bacterium]|nr:type 4a pilus biogenesis protein PilO [bacterium]
MRKYLLVIINFLLICAVAGIFVVPRFQEYRLLKTEFVQKTADLKAENDYFNNLKDSRKRLSDYQSEMDKITAGIPVGLDLPILFDYLQKIAVQEGLIMNKIGLGQAGLAPDNSAIRGASVFLDVLGPYSAFRGFLRQIEKSSRLIQVETLSILTAQEGQKQDVINYRLTVSINFLTDSQTVSP